MISIKQIWFLHCAATKVFEDALNAIKCLDWLKELGPAHNILEPVEGQGITTLVFGTILVI